MEKDKLELGNLKSKILQLQRLSIKKDEKLNAPTAEQLMLMKKKMIHQRYTKYNNTKDKTSTDEHVMFFDIKTDNGTSIRDF